jgi:hypothetical protein
MDAREALMVAKTLSRRETRVNLPAGQMAPDAVE